MGKPLAVRDQQQKNPARGREPGTTGGYGMQTSEVLNRAADVLEAEGWWSLDSGGRGDLHKPSATCADVALSRASQRLAVEIGPARRALTEHIGGEDGADIWRWNDAPDRTAHEVIATLRACAVIEAAKENASVVEAVSA